MPFDDFHICRNKEIEHHRSRYIPESKFIMKPKVPVDGDISYQINPRRNTTTMKSRNIIKASYDKPCRIDSQITTSEKPFPIRVLGPGKPKSDTTEKEKHVNTYIPHPSKSEKHIGTGQTHMEQDDEKHRRTHQLHTKARNIRQFYIFNLQHELMI